MGLHRFIATSVVFWQNFMLPRAKLSSEVEKPPPPPPFQGINKIEILDANTRNLVVRLPGYGNLPSGRYPEKISLPIKQGISLYRC